MGAMLRQLPAADADLRAGVLIKKKLIFLLWCLWVISRASVFAEDMVVAVNPNNGVDKLSREEIKDLYHGAGQEIHCRCCSVAARSAQRFR